MAEHLCHPAQHQRGLQRLRQDPAHEALDDAGRRRLNGVAGQSILTALLLLAANVRKIAPSWRIRRCGERTLITPGSVHAADAPVRWRPRASASSVNAGPDPPLIALASSPSPSPRLNQQVGSASQDRRVRASGGYLSDRWVLGRPNLRSPARFVPAFLPKGPPKPFSARVLSVGVPKFCWEPCVGEAGLEPAHPFGHRNLNPARLPIPPLARVTGQQYSLEGQPRFAPAPVRDTGGQVRRLPNPCGAQRAGNLWETMGLQQFEERLERLVEGTLAKPFRSNLQPVEIGRRLTREMDLHRRVGVRGLIAPNAFAVTLSPADVSRFSNFIDALSRELADAAREHARIEGYSFVGPVEVEIFEAPVSSRGGSRSRRTCTRARTVASWPSSCCRTAAG